MQVFRQSRPAAKKVPSKWQTAILSEHNRHSTWLLAYWQSPASVEYKEECFHCLASLIGANRRSHRCFPVCAAETNEARVFYSLHNDSRAFMKARTKKYYPCSRQNTIFGNGPQAAGYANSPKPRWKTKETRHWNDRTQWPRHVPLFWSLGACSVPFVWNGPIQTKAWTQHKRKRRPISKTVHYWIKENRLIIQGYILSNKDKQKDSGKNKRTKQWELISAKTRRSTKQQRRQRQARTTAHKIQRLSNSPCFVVMQNTLPLMFKKYITRFRVI